MATFTSVPQTTSSQFRHYDPTSLKRTQSKPKAKMTGHTLREDCREVATQSLGLLHQESEGDLPAVPRQPPQVQKTGHIEDVEDMDSGMCDLFGAGHGKSIHEFASGDGHHQLRLELRDEGEKDHATIDLTLNGLFDRSSRDFHPIGESGATEEHRSATNFQRSNGASDYPDKSYHPTTANEGDHAKQRGDLAAAVGNAFSVEDIEDPYHKGSLAEDETFSGIASVINGPSTTPKRSHQSSVIDTTTTIPENSHPAKRRRMAERQAQSPILEPTYTPKSTVMLDLSDQVSRPSTSDGPIPGSQGAGRKDDGTTSLALPSTDLRDVEDGDGAYAQGAVEELLQARGSIPPSEGLEFEQDVGRESDRRVMNRQGSGSKVGEIFEEELSHNEACNSPQSRSQRRRRRAWAPETGRELSNTALRPSDCNTVPTRALQQARSSQPQQKSMPGRPNIDKRPRSCSPRSYSPGTTAGDRTNINYESGLGMSCQITDLTLCAIPNGFSIVTAILRHGDSNWSPDLVALDHKFLGEQGKVIRITQLSLGSWMLLGYRCDNGALDVCDRRDLNAKWISSSHSDASSHGTDNSDDDSDKEGENGEEVIKECNRRTHKPWLESDEVRLLSLKDKQGMEWQEIYKRFPDRSPGAVKLRYYTLRKRE